MEPKIKWITVEYFCFSAFQASPTSHQKNIYIKRSIHHNAIIDGQLPPQDGSIKGSKAQEFRKDDMRIWREETGWEDSSCVWYGP